MDIQKLLSIKHWLNYSSFTLSLENQILLTNSLLVLQNENHFKKTFFWGIIQGIEADYFIAFGYMNDAVTDRKYFYSDDGQNWKLLPVPTKEHLILSELCKKPFQGDPGLVLEIVDDAPPNELFPPEEECPPEETETDIDKPNTIEEGRQNTLEEEIQTRSDIQAIENKGELQNSSDILKSENEDEIGDTQIGEVISLQEVMVDDEAPITSGELQEENRLAATVHIISEDAAIVPRGGMFRETDGKNVHSKAFGGLDIDDTDSLCSFQHYRLPQKDCNTNLLCRCDYNYALDFLDPIDVDIPSDCWSAHLVEGDRTVIIRNLYWPGFMFFHYVGNPEHGFIYVGPGYRNLDIPFMTQVSRPVEEPTNEEPPEEELKELIEGESTSQLPDEITLQRSSKTSSKISRGEEVRESTYEIPNTIVEDPEEEMSMSH